VAALFTVTLGISTPLAAFGVFLPVIAETFGWSRGAIASALSLNLVVGGLAGYVVGTLADRHGPRIMMLVTVGLAGSAFALVSTIGALWHLYLLIGVVGGVGMSSFYLLSTSTVAHWFAERRGLAIALVLIGFNVGYMSAGPLAVWLIAQLGWRLAYAVLGAGCAALTFCAAATVRLPRGSERRAIAPVAARTGAVAGVTLRQALRDPRYWYLNVAWLLLGAIIFMISVHAVPYARDRGVTLAVASLALTAYGLGSVTGRLTAGLLSDRVGLRVATTSGYAIEFTALVLLATAPSSTTLLAAMALFGFGAAATDNMLVRAIPDLFGLRAIGALTGVLTLGWRCGAALGPSAAGFLYDATGSYAGAFGTAPFVVVVSFVLFTLATRRPRSAAA
jgi:OFA family oxalate/formate antiporter-like MFS transporter